MEKRNISAKEQSATHKESRAESPEDPDAKIRGEIRQTLKEKGIKGVVSEISGWTSKGITAEKIFTIINAIINENKPGDALYVAIALYQGKAPTETIRAFWETVGIGMMEESEDFAIAVLNRIAPYEEEAPQETIRAFWETVGIKMMKKSERFASAAIHRIPTPNSPGASKEAWMEGTMMEDAMIAAMRYPSIAENIALFGEKEFFWGGYSWWGNAKEQAKKTVLEEFKTNRKFAEEFLHDFGADEYEEYGEIISEAIQYYPAAEIFIEEVDRRKASSQIEEEEREKMSSLWVDQQYEKAKALRKRVAQEALEYRDRIVEDRDGYTLSKEEFKEYFESKTMRQGNVGNSYMVAAIYALREWPHAEVVLRKSVKRNSDGSWEVRFPFMDAEGEAVTITREEMQPQGNEEFEEERPGENGIDERETLYPLEGPEGCQVLEAALIKKYFDRVDRANRKVDRVKGERGYSRMVLKTFGGELFEHDKFDEHHMELADVILKNFDPEIYIATCSCLRRSGGDEVRVNGAVTTERGGSETLEEKEIEIKKYHTYAVKSVDRKREEVRIVNPRDTAEVLVMSFEKFREIFKEVQMVRVNNEKLLEEYKKADAAHDYEER